MIKIQYLWEFPRFCSNITDVLKYLGSLYCTHTVVREMVQVCRCLNWPEKEKRRQIDLSVGPIFHTVATAHKRACMYSHHNNNSLCFPKQSWPFSGCGCFQCHVDISVSDRGTANVYVDVKLFSNWWHTVLWILWWRRNRMYFPTDILGDTAAILRNAVSHDTFYIQSSVICLFIPKHIHCSWISKCPGARAQDAKRWRQIVL